MNIPVKKIYNNNLPQEAYPKHIIDAFVQHLVSQKREIENGRNGASKPMSLAADSSQGEPKHSFF
jgi:hypothetical protein